MPKDRRLGRAAFGLGWITRPRAPGEPPTQSYGAFISYSHADTALAVALQAGLHQFAKPWYRLRAVRVFRDEASLSANPALWTSIREALSASGFLILLASPEAAGSRWVQQEIEYWREHRPLRSLLIAVTDGDLAWDESACDFDWTRTNALPVALRGIFDEEPRFVDLRFARRAEGLSVRHFRFRDCVADLAGPIHGRPKDELLGEDVRQHRRTIRVARAAAAGLAALTATAVAFAIVAFLQRNRAISERDRAVSRELAADANAQLPRDPSLSLLLAREALRRTVTDEAVAALRDALVVSRDYVVGVPATVPLPSSVSTAFGPDGTLLVTRASDGIDVWSLRDARSVSHLQTDAARAFFSPDGRRLVTLGTDSSAVVWDWARRHVLARLRRSGALFSAAFSPDSNLIASAGEDGVSLVWRWRRGQVVAALPGSGDARDAEFAPDGERVVVAGTRGARVWAWPSRESLAALPGELTHASFDPSGKLLAAAAADGSARIWDWTRKRTLAVLRGDSELEAAAFDPTGPLVLTCALDGTARVWDWRKQEVVAELRVPGKLVGGGFSPDGRRVVLVALDGVTRVWSWAADRVRGELRGGPSLARPTFSPDGRLVGAVSASGTAQIWDWATDGELAELPVGPGANREVFSPDGRLVAMAGKDGTARVWDWRRRQMVALLRGQSDLRDAAFSPNGKLVVTAAANGVISVWDWAHVRRVVKLVAGVDVNRASFSADGRLIASASADGAARVWDWRPQRLLATLEVPRLDIPGLPPNVPLSDASFSPDGRYVVTAGMAHTLVWDWRARRKVAVLRAPEEGAFDFVGGGHFVIDSASFSPDGTLIVTVDAGGLARVWDWKRERSLLRISLPGSKYFFNSAALSPDGRHLLVGGISEARVYSCDVCGSTGTLLATATARSARVFSAAERVSYLHAPSS